MLARLNQFIVNCSTSWWKTLLLLAGQTSSLLVLLRIEAGFPAIASGATPFDMQNQLTVTQIFEQLPGYSDAAFRSYFVFQAVDFVFPLLGGLFMAAVFSFALRHAAPGWYATAVNWKLLVLLLAATLFDYLENLNFFWVVNVWPDEAMVAAQLGVLAKQAKLACMSLVFGLTGLLLLVALVRRGAAVLNKNADS